MSQHANFALTPQPPAESQPALRCPHCQQGLPPQAVVIQAHDHDCQPTRLRCSVFCDQCNHVLVWVQDLHALAHGPRINHEQLRLITGFRMVRWFQRHGQRISTHYGPGEAAGPPCR